MDRIVLMFVALVAVTTASVSNEQHGRFFLYKVKPRNAEQTQQLLRSNEAYESNPPIFLQEVLAGKSALVLIEQSKAVVFDRALRTNRIKATKMGMSLVESISTRSPPLSAAEGISCDCNYHHGGCTISSNRAPPEGYKCKCVYRGAWTCTGYPFTCDRNEHCPANCSSRECCLTGGGDCGGY